MTREALSVELLPHPRLQESYTGLGKTPSRFQVFWSFLTKTKQKPPIPSHFPGLLLLGALYLPYPYFGPKLHHCNGSAAHQGPIPTLPCQQTWAFCCSLKVLFLDTRYAYFLLMWFGGQRQCGEQGQQGGEDQGGHWHEDISLRLELRCDELWRWCLISKFFIFSLCPTTWNKCELVVNDTVDAKHNAEKKTIRYDQNAPPL